jgi:hypothetical protein
MILTDIFAVACECAGDGLVVIGVARHRARERRQVIDDGGEIEKSGAERLRHLGV